MAGGFEEEREEWEGGAGVLIVENAGCGMPVMEEQYLSDKNNGQPNRNGIILIN